MHLIFDIEANGLTELTLNKSKEIHSNEVTKVWCVSVADLHSDKVWFFGPNKIDEAVKLLESATYLAGHNIIMYDLEVLKRLHGLKWTVDQVKYDTLIVSKLIFPDFKNHPLGDNTLKSWGKYLKVRKLEYNGGYSEYTSDMGKYNMRDAILGRKILQWQIEWIEKNKYHNPVKIEQAAAAVISKQISHGFNFDLMAAYQAKEQITIAKADINDELQRVFPPITIKRVSEKTGKELNPKIIVFNPNSRKMIASRLSEMYGWVPPMTDKNNPKVDEATLSGLDYPEVPLLLQYIRLGKLEGQLLDFIARATSSRDGRIHGFVNTLGAITGRCTHSQPNMSQTDKDPLIRTLWIPDSPDHVIVGTDIKGEELRVLGDLFHQWDNGAYSDVILNADIHEHNKKLAGLQNREDAKTLIYAICYGCGPAKAGKIVGGNANKGKALLNRFYKELPALARAQEYIKSMYQKYKCVVLKDGRKIPVRKEYAGLNTYIQGTGAILSKLWMIILNNKIVEHGLEDDIHQLVFSHDELQFSCPKEHAETLAQWSKDAAAEAGEMMKLTIRIDADVKIGNSWSETH